MQDKTTKCRGILIMVLICAVFFMASGMTPLYAGKCEEAFLHCIYDPFWQNIFGSVYCANGYIFCKKYVE